MSQLPLGERHLTRLKDYTIDPFSGRVLLNQPLSSCAMPGVLQADPLTGGVVQQLFVDYEFLDTSGGAFTFGGELNGRLGPVTLLASGFRDGAYSLFRGSAKATLGPVLLSAEAAYSLGAIEGLSFSRDGGLTSAQATSLPNGSGFAAAVRLTGVLAAAGRAVATPAEVLAALPDTGCMTTMVWPGLKRASASTSQA